MKSDHWFICMSIKKHLDQTDTSIKYNRELLSRKRKFWTTHFLWVHLFILPTMLFSGDSCTQYNLPISLSSNKWLQCLSVLHQYLFSSHNISSLSPALQQSDTRFLHSSYFIISPAHYHFLLFLSIFPFILSCIIRVFYPPFTHSDSICVLSVFISLSPSSVHFILINAVCRGKGFSDSGQKELP